MICKRSTSRGHNIMFAVVTRLETKHQKVLCWTLARRGQEVAVLRAENQDFQVRAAKNKDRWIFRCSKNCKKGLEILHKASGKSIGSSNPGRILCSSLHSDLVMQ